MSKSRIKHRRLKLKPEHKPGKSEFQQSSANYHTIGSAGWWKNIRDTLKPLVETLDVNWGR